MVGTDVMWRVVNEFSELDKCQIIKIFVYYV